MAERSDAVFAISVVADMVSMEIQNLRVYERHGLVTPGRTDGGTRRYSQDDVDRLHRVRDLLADGLNLAGVARVMALQDENDGLRRENADLRRGRQEGAGPE
jgi:MerR family transcriptional regulator/heat shock protein HspR